MTLPCAARKGALPDDGSGWQSSSEMVKIVATTDSAAPRGLIVVAPSRGHALCAHHVNCNPARGGAKRPAESRAERGTARNDRTPNPCVPQAPRVERSGATGEAQRSEASGVLTDIARELDALNTRPYIAGEPSTRKEPA